MSRYDPQGPMDRQPSIWKITLGVAFGIVLACTFFVLFTGFALWGVSEAIEKTIGEQNNQIIQQFQQLSKQFSNKESLRVAPIIRPSFDLSQNQGFIQAPIIPETKDDLVKEESKKAYVIARKEVDDFRSHYKKPEECYNMQNNATRMRCANDFIRARKAYEALNQ